MAIHSKFENKWINLELIEAVLKRGPTDATLRLVLIALIYRQRRNRAAYVKRKTLALDIGRCEKTTRNATNRLKELGWLSIEIGAGEDGRNHYSVHEPNRAVILDPEEISGGEMHDHDPGNSRPAARKPASPQEEEGKKEEEEYPPTAPQGDGADLPCRITIVAEKVAGGLRPGCPTIDAEFQTVWAYYPRRVGTGKAREAWAKARRRATYAEIAAPLGQWIKLQRGTPIDKVPHFATWLNQERWNDDQTHARNRAETTSDRLARLGAGPSAAGNDHGGAEIRKAPVVELRLAK